MKSFNVAILLGVILCGCSKPSYQFNSATEPEGVEAAPFPKGFKSTPETRLRMATRGYISSALKDIFGPSAASIVDKHVTMQIVAFGGEPCDPNAEACASIVGGSQLPLVPFAMPARIVFTTRACEEIVSLDTALKKAIENAQASIQIASVVPLPAQIRRPSEADIEAAFDLFYVGRSIPSNVSEDLKALVDTAAGRGLVPLEQWRLLIGTLCESPGWQIP